MNFLSRLHPVFSRFIPLLILSIGLLVPLSESPVAQAGEVIVEEPQLFPPYTTCDNSFWYKFINNRGHAAYLTLNVSSLADSTNHGEWHPVIPQNGYYRVEAYIPAHNPIYWCTTNRLKEHDTTDAHYSIHHAYGISTRSISQHPLANQWLVLGEYYFKSGTLGYVNLTDLNNELEYTTTISFSAMRFTFTRPTRPNIYLPLVNNTHPIDQPPANVGVIQGQGFDACHLPTVAEMQTWWTRSPYSFYGLYLGGIHLPAMCVVADASWVRAVHQQGWGFVPTWVGPQAPCTDYHYRMSADPAVSYQEGRREAEAASAAAVSRGLSSPEGGGTIIYYDLEAYGVSTPACRQPVAAFINGWVGRLDELGNKAGGYGTRNSFVADWATIPNPPDNVWAASWYTNAYDPAATTLGITWLEGLWTRHQRIRQYAGDHGETWGGVRFAIDSDVADGAVAMPPIPKGIPLPGFIAPALGDTGWLSTEQGWLVSGNKLYWTDDLGENWRDISPASTQLAYFLPSGQAWALGTQDGDFLSLYHSSAWGASWDILKLPLPDGVWRAIQIRFTTSTSGWVVLQKATSQAFDIAILMKTTDGGTTWRSFTLPSAAPVQFTSSVEGWMTNRAGDGLYKTSDGGLTWRRTEPKQLPLPQPSIPADSILSGWQSESLGWSVASAGSCSGQKSTSSFTCQVENSLERTLDGGQTWVTVPLP